MATRHKQNQKILSQRVNPPLPFGHSPRDLKSFVDLLERQRLPKNSIKQKGSENRLSLAQNVPYYI